MSDSDMPEVPPKTQWRGWTSKKQKWGKRILYKRKPGQPDWVPPPSPSRRNIPWLNISVKAEYYAMLREIAQYYEAPLTKVTAALIANHFIKLLEITDPVQARQLKGELAGEKHFENITKLDT